VYTNPLKRRGYRLWCAILACATVSLPLTALHVVADAGPTLSLAGIVTAPEGAPLANARLFWTVSIRDSRQSTVQQPILASAPTAPDGSFTLSFPTENALPYVTPGHHLNTEVTALGRTTTGTGGVMGHWAIPYDATNVSGALQLIPMNPLPTPLLPTYSTAYTISCTGQPVCGFLPPIPITCSETAVSTGTASAYTTVAELHGTDDMTSEFDYINTATTTVDTGYSYANAPWVTADSGAAVDNNKGGGNKYTTQGLSFPRISSPMEVQIAYDQQWQEFHCSDGSTWVDKSVGPDVTGAAGGFLLGPSQAGDGPGEYRAHNDTQHVSDLMPGATAIKNAGTTQRFSNAFNVFGFTGGAQSVFDSNLTYNWTMNPYLPAWVPQTGYQAMTSYHLWGDNACPNCGASQVVYAASGDEQVSGDSSSTSSLTYTAPTYATQPASCTSDSFSIQSSQPVELVLYVDHNPGYQVWRGTFGFNGSGGSTCAGPSESGSISLNFYAISGTGLAGMDVNCPSSLTGGYSIFQHSFQVAVSGSCDVNGVQTGSLGLFLDGAFSPATTGTGSPIWSATSGGDLSIN
jgi:hypothetical protein